MTQDSTHQDRRHHSDDSQIEIRGQKIDLGDAFPAHIREHLGEILQKYCNHAAPAHVVVHKERDLFYTDIRVAVNKRLSLQAEGNASDPYASFHVALAHVGKRLRRYKRRLREDHKHQEKNSELFAKNYILKVSERDRVEDENWRYDNVQPHAAPADNDDEHLIVAEQDSALEVCSVSDAVMHMEFLNKDHLLFIDVQSRRVNLVYRRKDGHIGWVDPKTTSGL